MGDQVVDTRAAGPRSDWSLVDCSGVPSKHSPKVFRALSHGVEEAAAGWFIQKMRVVHVLTSWLGNGPGRFVSFHTTDNVAMSGVANASLPCV